MTTESLGTTVAPFGGANESLYPDACLQRQRTRLIAYITRSWSGRAYRSYQWSTASHPISSDRIPLTSAAAAAGVQLVLVVMRVISHNQSNVHSSIYSFVGSFVRCRSHEGVTSKLFGALKHPLPLPPPPEIKCKNNHDEFTKWLYGNIRHMQKQPHFFNFSISFNRTDNICSHQTRFLDSIYTRNVFAAGARSQTHFWCI